MKRKTNDQIIKKLLIKDESGRVIGIKGDVKVEPCKGQLQNPQKKKFKAARKLRKQRRN